MTRLPSTASMNAFVLLLCVTSLFSLLDGVHSSGQIDCGSCACKAIDGFGVLEVNCSSRGLVAVPEFLSNGSFVNVSVLFLQKNQITILNRHDFDGLPKLVSIDLSSNGLTTITSGTFRHWNKTILIQLYLSHNLLGLSNSTFDLGTMNVWDLHLSSNHFTEVPSTTLRQLTDLQYLNLQDNPIYIVRNGTFLGWMLSTKTLDLSNCRLTTLEEGAFSGLFFLQELYLNGNNLGNINGSMFDFHLFQLLSMVNAGITSIARNTFKLVALKELILDRNDFSAGLDRFHFTDLTQLELLSMRYCRLTSLKRNLFHMRVNGKIDLEGNNINIIQPRTFKNLRGVKEIVLTQCNITRIKGIPFQNLTNLERLLLDDNQLTNSSYGFLQESGKKLKVLYLNHNNLTDVPDLSALKRLVEVRLEYNRIEQVRSNAFSSNTLLKGIRLTGNRPLRTIANDSFVTLGRVTKIDLSYTSVKVLPSLINKPTLYTLNIPHAQLEELPTNICETCPKLFSLYANNNTIATIPSLTNCKRLEIIFLQANRISNLSHLPFTGHKRIEHIRLENNNIQNLPDHVFGGMLSLRYLYLYANQIASVSRNAFFNSTRLTVLSLAYNRIHTLVSDVFRSSGELETLELNDNDLRQISQSAFPASMLFLRYLDVSNNTELDRFPVPASGFLNLYILRLINLPLLLDVPTPEQIPMIEVINFTYPYSCCVFRDYIRPDTLYSGGPTTAPSPSVDEDGDIDDNPHLPATTRPTISTEDFTTPSPNQQPSPTNLTVEEAFRRFAEANNISVNIFPSGQNVVSNGNGPLVEDDDERTIDSFNSKPLPVPRRDDGIISCYPLPDPLTPCENLLGDGDALRVLIWAVWVLAILGNIMVLFIIASGDNIKVPDFIICNLAVADFLMGVYLAFLAIVDIRTFGPRSFFKSALQWQHSTGCRSAGFIAVFSSMQSLYILVIITLERLQTVVYSFNGGSRMNWCHAMLLVSLGWVFAGVMAAIPLLPFEINSYTDVAVCLPIRTYSVKDKIYLGVILGVNVISFLIIMGSYLHMFLLFCKSPAANGRKRERICTAWKMSILVGTALVCWLPLTIVGVSALLDRPLVTLVTAKYLIVLVLPINACLNPFLYAFVTQQFRERLATICQRASRRIQNGSSSHHSIIRRSSLPYTNSSTNTSRGPSPHSGINMNLLALRQSRRSNSCEMGITQPAIPPTRGPMPNMGRRNSSPAIFSTDITVTSPNLGFQLPTCTQAEHTEISFTSSSDEYRTDVLSVVQEESESEESDSEDTNEMNSIPENDTQCHRLRSRTMSPSDISLSAEMQETDCCTRNYLPEAHSTPDCGEQLEEQDSSLPTEPCSQTEHSCTQVVRVLNPHTNRQHHRPRPETEV